MSLKRINLGIVFRDKNVDLPISCMNEAPKQGINEEYRNGTLEPETGPMETEVA